MSNTPGSIILPLPFYPRRRQPVVEHDEIFTQANVMSAYEVFAQELSEAAPTETDQILAFEHLFNRVSGAYKAELVKQRLETTWAHQRRVDEMVDTHHAKLDRQRAEVQEYLIQLERAKAEISVLLSKNESMADKLKVCEDYVADLKAQINYSQSRLQIAQAGVLPPGSATRRATWGIVAGLGTTMMNQTLPVLSDCIISEPNADDLLNQEFTKEPEMYTPVTEWLAVHLNRDPTAQHPGVIVFDTHSNHYLGTYAPDITISIGGVKEPHPSSVYMIIELKAPTHAFDDEDFGQVYDYVLSLCAFQPNRRYIAALLSNLDKNHVIILDVRDGPNSCNVKHFQSVMFTDAIKFIKHIVLQDSSYCPPVPSFSHDLGLMERRLGNPNHSVVAEFYIPAKSLRHLSERWPTDTIGKTMAVKVPAKDSGGSADIRREILILQQINRVGGCNQLPRLVYFNPEYTELGIAPVGRQLDPLTLSENTTRTVLCDILSGLIWLHKRGIIHRDVRRQNVIVASQGQFQGEIRWGGRLIDFGASTRIGGGEPQLYLGGYICCPYEVIGNFRKMYQPSPSHDYLAFVMMVNLLVFPYVMHGLVSNKVGEETGESVRLRKYWGQMKQSSVWSPFVKAAEEEDTLTLAKLSELWVLL